MSFDGMRRVRELIVRAETQKLDEITDKLDTRYFIRPKGEDHEREVSKQEFIEFERSCGFVAKLGEGHVATAMFHCPLGSGRVEPLSGS